MPCSCQVIDDGKILIHLHEGVVTLEAIEKLTKETEDLLQGKLVDGVLVDALAVESGPGKAEVLLWMKSKPAMPLYGRKTAFLSNEGLADVFEFISLALQNRGAAACEFKDRDEALRWLRTPADE